MKLMDIDTDTLGIPDTEYDAKVSMPASEFQRICRELSQLGESVRIEVNKEGIRFNSEGDIANGSILLKPTDGGSGRYEKNGSSSKEAKPKVKKEKTDDEAMEEDDGGSIKEGREEKPSRAEEEEEPASEREEEEEEESSKKRKRKSGASGGKAKKAKTDEDVDVVSISVTQAVSLSFSLKYLVNFTKSTGLTNHVELKMSADVPLLVCIQPIIGIFFG